MINSAKVKISSTSRQRRRNVVAASQPEETSICSIFFVHGTATAGQFCCFCSSTLRYILMYFCLQQQGVGQWGICEHERQRQRMERNTSESFHSSWWPWIKSIGEKRGVSKQLGDFHRSLAGCQSTTKKSIGDRTHESRTQPMLSNDELTFLQSCLVSLLFPYGAAAQDHSNCMTNDDIRQTDKHIYGALRAINLIGNFSPSLSLSLSRFLSFLYVEMSIHQLPFTTKKRYKDSDLTRETLPAPTKR